MKRVAFLTIFLVLSVFASSSRSEERPSRFYALPIMEVEEALARWMIASGFHVSRASAGMGQMDLKGVKGNEEWEVHLRPRSALACDIHAEYRVNGGGREGKVDEMWAYLDRYLSRETAGADVPSAVLARGSSVVCLRAKVETGDLQFSGFLIGKNGRILSTAHDLNAVREITVWLSNGKESKGDLIKIDAHRDLILVNSHVRSDVSVSLEDGRKALKNGEKVYALGCPTNAHRAVHSGVVDGPLRHASGLPLWQVIMETLPGGSGSPVFDSHGNLVAVVKGRYRGNDSVGFLIPLETVIEFLKDQ